MTWARLDDGITDNPRLLALPRGQRLVHLEGIVWSCRHETDGRIPRHVLRKVTDEPDPEDAASALVDVGLWETVDDGWEIVGFLDDQRSADDIAKTRAAALERQRRHRQHTGGDHSLCNPRYCRAARDLSRVTDGVTNGGSHSPPTRPDPTRPKGREGKGTGTPGADGAGGPPGAEPQGTPPAELLERAEQVGATLAQQIRDTGHPPGEEAFTDAMQAAIPEYYQLDDELGDQLVDAAFPLVGQAIDEVLSQSAERNVS